MTDFASLLVPDRGQKARLIHLVDKGSFDAWLKARPAEDRALIEAHRFDGKKGSAFVILPRGNEFEVVSAVKDAAELSPWCLAKLAESLPEGTYKLASGDVGQAALGWLLRRSVEKRESLETKLTEFRIEVAKEYVTHIDLAEIKSALIRIEATINAKADK